MRSLRFALPLVLLLPAHIRAQEEDTLSYAEVYDSSYVVEGEGTLQDTVVPQHEARAFSGTALEQYRKDPDLQYDKPIIEEPGFWDRFMAWLADLLTRWFGKGVSKAVSTFLNKYVIHFVIIAGALVLLVIALRKAVFTKAFSGKAMRATVVSDVHEELHREDLEALAAKAEHEKEWRRAVRLRYLQVLRHGIDNGWLQWRPEYTDRDYAAQLTDETSRALFSRIAFTFQWAWYGEADLDKERYDALIAPFHTFAARKAA